MEIPHLECTRCDSQYSTGEIHNLCKKCRAPLFVRYDLREIAKKVHKGDFVTTRENSIWRYKELLPVKDENNIISLGEGYTPLFHASSLGNEIGLKSLYIKDESLNPTGSFKARGMSVAISKARELGIKKVVAPSAGNAGGAISAYAAKAGLEAYVFMPKDVPKTFLVECESYGAKIELIDGTIADCGKVVQERKDREGWFDVSTLKEPYRVEGKKTMGYELAEQFSWQLPDVIIYPTGGGTGLIGMWKAFQEMEELGWIDSKRPRMISVQASGCAPIVKAFEEEKEHAEEWENPETIASGLRVPKAIGDFLMLKSIRESGGVAMAVSDAEIIEAVKIMARLEGIFPAPEGAATFACLSKLRKLKLIDEDERIVLFNTGSGLKYVDSLEVRIR